MRRPRAVGRFGSVVRSGLRLLVLALVLVVFAGPLVWVLASSLTDPTLSPGRSGFEQLGVTSFALALRLRAGDALLNSILIAAAVSAMSTALGALSGYGFARWGIGGLKLPFAILAIRMMPVVVLLVPIFMLIAAVGLVDSHAAIIAAHLIITLPFAVWMMRGFFLELPRELEEAAMIDGCTRLQSMVRIAMPLAAPGIAVTALFCFVFSWNEFPFALVLSRNTAMTLPVVLSGLAGDDGTMSAAAVMGILPVFGLALFAQKYLARGMMLGAVR